MKRAIRIGLLSAIVSVSVHSQDASRVAKNLEKTLAELEGELRHIQRVLQELSRLTKAAGVTTTQGLTSSTPQAEAVSNLVLAQEAYQRGKIAEERRQYEAAIEAFTKAIELFPKNEVNFLRRGRVYLELGSPELALRDLNQSLLIQ